MFTVTSMSSRRPTLHDVARIAGVSHVTVSRVVRGNQVVAPSTVARVKAAIKQLGYSPDPALSALAAYRSNSRRGHGSTLAFLECEETSYGQSILAGVQSEAERLGYATSRHLLPQAPQLQAKLWRILYHRGIRGIIVGSSREAIAFPKWDWTPFAVVSLSAMTRQPALHTVTTDYFAGVVLAMQHLRELGAHRIGYAVDDIHEKRTANRWLGGYLATLGGQKPLIYPRPMNNADDISRWMKSSGIDSILTIHHTVWSARPSPAIRTVFLSHFDCPPTVPCIIYDPKKIGIEGVRMIHHLCLNHEFGLPREIKAVNLQPYLSLPE